MSPAGPSGIAAEPARDVSIVLTTVPDLDTGERIVRQLVEERLIACGNLVPGVASIYRWKGEVQHEGEVLVVMKTRSATLERLFRRAGELHPYEVPELLSIPVGAGLPAYCEWVVEETSEVHA
ncbi:MAG TPA: divalent-cation tolerance protein CutA [Longimicrobiaceae bacterium]|nr:divalent-cation tolerance protein CutA [Longimicrobiaceae bacterium]